MTPSRAAEHVPQRRSSYILRSLPRRYRSAAAWIPNGQVRASPAPRRRPEGCAGRRRLMRDGAERRLRPLFVALREHAVQPAGLDALVVGGAGLHEVLHVEVRARCVGRAAGVDDREVSRLVERRSTAFERRVQAEEVRRGRARSAVASRDAAVGWRCPGGACSRTGRHAARPSTGRRPHRAGRCRRAPSCRSAAAGGVRRQGRSARDRGPYIEPAPIAAKAIPPRFRKKLRRDVHGFHFLN